MCSLGNGSYAVTLSVSPNELMLCLPVLRLFTSATGVANLVKSVPSKAILFPYPSDLDYTSVVVPDTTLDYNLHIHLFFETTLDLPSSA